MPVRFHGISRLRKPRGDLQSQDHKIYLAMVISYLWNKKKKKKIKNIVVSKVVIAKSCVEIDLL